MWEYQKLVGRHVTSLQDSERSSGVICVVEMAWNFFPSENGLWEPYHGTLPGNMPSAWLKSLGVSLGPVKNGILFRDFSGQIILGCSRKLGSMVRITGLQTPRNTPFIIRWNKPIDLPFTNFQRDIQVIVIFFPGSNGPWAGSVWIFHK